MIVVLGSRPSVNMGHLSALRSRRMMRSMRSAPRKLGGTQVEDGAGRPTAAGQGAIAEDADVAESAAA